MEPAEKDVECVKPRIMEVIRAECVVTEREIKIRLEREFFPWVTGRGLDALVDSGLVRVHGYRGRHRLGRGVPEKFYILSGTAYSDVERLIQEKRQVSADVATVLMGESPVGYHAENLFYDAFEELGFTVHGRNVSEFCGRRAQGVPGKELPNIDLVVKKDGVTYGVEVKNWLKYE